MGKIIRFHRAPKGRAAVLRRNVHVAGEEALDILVGVIKRYQRHRKTLMRAPVANAKLITRLNLEMDAMMWVASQAVEMSGGGNPDDYLMNTPVDLELRHLMREEGWK